MGSVKTVRSGETSRAWGDRGQGKQVGQGRLGGSNKYKLFSAYRVTNVPKKVVTALMLMMRLFLTLFKIFT